MAEENEKSIDELREELDLREEFELEGDDYAPDEHGANYEIPSADYEEDDNSWCGYMPPKHRGGPAIYIEGVMPSTRHTRQAMELVPNKMKRDALLGLKEAQENLLRICIRQIGPKTVGLNDLRGTGLDKHLTAKQMHFVTSLFDRMTTPDQADTEDFLSTVREGQKRKG